SNNQLLGGATFKVCGPSYPTPNCVSVTDNQSPDADSTAGKFKLVNLILGTYTIQETVAPVGYDLDPTIATVTLTLASPSNAVPGPTFKDPPGPRSQFVPTQTTCSQ